jgi:hypothetical protein
MPPAKPGCGLRLLVVSFFLAVGGSPQRREVLLRAWPAAVHSAAARPDSASCPLPIPQPANPGLQTYRLALDRHHYLPAPVRLVAEDLSLELEQGAGFVALVDERPTALVLVGSGTLRFSPPVRSEQRQLQLFGGAPILTAAFDSAFVRLHPAVFDSSVTPGRLLEATPPPDLLRRAQTIFDEEIGRSFVFEAPEPGQPGRTVSLLPSRDDSLAEIRTRRYGRLAYIRQTSEPEDITLVEREHGRRLAVYPSSAHRATLGFTYGDEYGLPYEAGHYDIEVEIDPARLAIAGRTRVHLHAVDTLETVKLGLDRGLVVSHVRSDEQGTHQFLQLPASNSLLVRLVPPLTTGQRIVLDVAYKGVAKPQGLGRGPDAPLVISPSWHAPHIASATGASILYSNRVYWFPQSPVRNHTTANLRVEVPSGFTAVASARLDPSSPDTGPSGTQTFAFRTEAPVRYLALLVGRFTAVGDEASPGMKDIRGVATPRLVSRARTVVRDVADMVRFFDSVVGDVPFSPLTAALVEVPEAAAHSPAYMAILGEPPGWNPATAGDDPAYLGAEPQLFLAHEVAHQWWGQAVGWRNYREQWLSEAFAQYFAALYIQHTRGEEAFAGVLAWMHRWALSAVEKGPINLGIRAGQIAGTPEDLVAILYDRGACVIHMLRGLLGDDVFFRALRLYYERWRFRRASTDDFRRVLEETSGLDLGRFFEQWVRDDGRPELRWAAEIDVAGDNRRLRLKIEQVGEAFELPLQVRIDYDDRPSTIERVGVSLTRHEYVFDLQGRFKRVRLNADLGALCQLREQR